MKKPNKTRLVCMNCLNSKEVEKREDDPKKTRLIVMWSCNKCSEDDDDIQFYDFQMRELDVNESST
jgi:hypothetical protein